MVTITDDFYSVTLSRWTFKCDHIKRLITLTSDFSRAAFMQADPQRAKK